jgi:hypothetical protein
MWLGTIPGDQGAPRVGMRVGKLPRKIYGKLPEQIRKFWIVTVTMVARKDSFTHLSSFRVTGVDMPMTPDVRVPFHRHGLEPIRTELCNVTHKNRSE